MIVYNFKDLNLSINNLTDKLICSCEYENEIYETEITINDLHSEFITLSKLQNIFTINNTKIQNGYKINLDKMYNNIGNINYLVLSIDYSNEFIDFNEKIYFKQKGTTYDIIIQKQNKKINELENKIKQLENDKYYTIFRSIISSSNSATFLIHHNVEYLNLCFVNANNNVFKFMIIIPSFHNSINYEYFELIYNIDCDKFNVECLFDKSIDMVKKNFYDILLKINIYKFNVHIDKTCDESNILIIIKNILNKIIFSNNKITTISIDNKNLYEDLQIKTYCNQNKISLVYVVSNANCISNANLILNTRIVKKLCKTKITNDTFW